MSDEIGLQHHNSPIDAAIDASLRTSGRILKVNNSCPIYLVYRFSNESSHLGKRFVLTPFLSLLSQESSAYWYYSLWNPLANACGGSISSHCSAARCISVSIIFFPVGTAFIGCNGRWNRKGYYSSSSWGGFTESVAVLQKLLVFWFSHWNQFLHTKFSMVTHSYLTIMALTSTHNHTAN